MGEQTASVRRPGFSPALDLPQADYMGPQHVSGVLQGIEDMKH